MNLLNTASTADRDRLPLPWDDEIKVVTQLQAQVATQLDWHEVRQQCQPWVRAIRDNPPAFWAMESLLQAYPLSSHEGLALMRLAEALLRVPDADTISLLLNEQLAKADFAHHPAPDHAALHANWEALTSKVLGLAQQIMASPSSDDGVWKAMLVKLGQPSVVAATMRALQLLGQQFVLAPTIEEGLSRAQAQSQADLSAGFQTTWSVDMLGEGARTWADAERHLTAYQHALNALSASFERHAAQQGEQVGKPIDRQGQGLSIKLSALHPRFEATRRDQVLQDLRPHLVALAKQAAQHDLLLTIDAEESTRLELQLAVFSDLLDALDDEPDTSNWCGLGLAIQAYQFRAPAMIDAVAELASQHDRRLTVRLVKGAYWDTEIKRAQELGLAGYPVYTHKAHTDLAYLACARQLIGYAPLLYPQFATHNATTIAGVLQWVKQARLPPQDYEWQRLYGMGEALYQAMRDSLPTSTCASVRVYAPVGPHRDLLAYLVRRLLENGANTSFMHQLLDPATSMDRLLAAPSLSTDQANQLLPRPRHLYGPDRLNSMGRDLQCNLHRQVMEGAISLNDGHSDAIAHTDPASAQALMAALHEAWPQWEAVPLSERCAILHRAADHIETQLESWAADLVLEARKTMADAINEVRETIDYARYYAVQALTQLAPKTLPGPTGEHNEWRARGRGVMVCIAPWNFPLAIFGGQVFAALLTGNTVAAKPAPQTPLIARRLVALLHAVGVPQQVLACAYGDGHIGEALVSHPACAGVVFTGSVQTAKRIQQTLAQAHRAIVPLIAETGGINAMVVDSSALPEQVVDSVISSAFGSAGQRCSALRLLALHQSVAADMEAMLAGAMQTLQTGRPEDWSTDVGPVIDAAAHARLLQHIDHLGHLAAQKTSGVQLIAQAPCPATPSEAPSADHWITPSAWRLPDVASLSGEHFGPVLHVVHWGPGTSAPTLDDLIDQINQSGFGLTMGLHTRMDARMQHVAQRAHVGNLYVNRGMTGAVVGVQPFGGQGWSGTGPKAGGPLYLWRLITEQVISINTTAAGGNAALLTQFSC